MMAHNAINSESTVGLKMKIRIHNKGVFEATENSSPPPVPLPAWDMWDAT